MARERVLNPLKRKILRTRISTWEIRFGAIFVVLLTLTGVWILAQRNNFDPSDRDISAEILQQGSVEDTLYRRPLQMWLEPGTAGGGPVSVDLGIFPQSILDDGWTVDGRVETYEPDNLYEKINGAAEQYLSFGFERLHYLTISDGKHFITIEVYDQGSFPNTLGIFAAQRDESRSVTTQSNLFFYPTPIGAVGGLGQYYFKISADTDAPPAVAKAKGLIEVLSSLSAGTQSTPRATTILTDDLGVPFEELSYVPTDAFQYAFAQDFWFGTTSQDPEARYFIHEAKDPTEAASMFGRLVEEQSYEYSVIDQSEDRAVFRHQFLETFFAISVSGNFVYGIDGSSNRQDADSGLRKIRGAIHG